MNARRRHAPRLPCQVTFRGTGGRESLAGQVADLSSAGLFLSIDRRLPVGTLVRLAFELALGRVQAEGEVRWVTPGGTGRFGVGIRFLRLSSHSAAAIEQAIKGPPANEDPAARPEHSTWPTDLELADLELLEEVSAELLAVHDVPDDPEDP